MSFFQPPNKDEVEITLFGTGGGYGESVLVKLGGSWIIIDSCINPRTGIPLSIDYLTKIGVDASENVKLVVCTHWHNDHILGLARTLEECKNARFVMPAVNDTKKFLQYVRLDYEKIKKGSESSTREFNECVEIVSKRAYKNIIRASSDKIIFSEKHIVESGKTILFELFALSPSEAVVSHFDLELSNLMADFKLSKVVVPEKSANEKSVALLIRSNEFSAILGADLEVGSKDDEGWKDIIKNSNSINSKAILYKIPHHGSINAYSEEIFNQLIDENAILKLTPWNRKNKLPEIQMVEKYKNHSNEVFITSSLDTLASKPKKRDKGLEKIAKRFSRKLTLMRFSEGIVRSRRNLESGEINVSTYGNAFKV